MYFCHSQRGIFSPAEQTETAHVQRDVSLIYIVAAGVGVGVDKGVLQLLQGDAVAAQPVRIGTNLVALDGAAAAGDVDDARDAAELSFKHPVLQRLEVVERVDVLPGGIFRTLQRVAVDFSGWRLRRELRSDAGR